jgi:UDP-GlcNAc3NAcA epimerase
VKILTVVGNRPQFIKAAAVSGPLREHHRETLVHTGQHHDELLSAVFFAELGLARPDRQLGVAGGSNASQTARMLAALEPLLADEHPDAAIVYGDTNSTLAGALAAAQAQVPVIHVEAGMRSFDRAMPEELNRRLTDHLASLLLCPSETAAANLRAEGIVAGPRLGAQTPAPSVHVVGDVMVDVALRWQPRARASGEALARHGVRPGEYLLLTAHRAGNVDDPRRLASLAELIRVLATRAPAGPELLFPVHPRTRARLRAARLEEPLASEPRVRLLDPLPYAELSALLCQASAVITDSGGVQKEAYIARVPCLTLRSSTEWPETVEHGWNTLVDLDPQAALAALARELPAEHPPLYGAGDAAQRCLAAIDDFATRLGAS